MSGYVPSLLRVTVFLVCISEKSSAHFRIAFHSLSINVQSLNFK